MSLGGEFHSCTKCVDFLTETENGKKCITGIAVEHTKTKERRTIEADAVLLASGHSANDIYDLVARCAPEALEAKTFAAGVRVEHPRKVCPTATRSSARVLSDRLPGLHEHPDGDDPWLPLYLFL